MPRNVRANRRATLELETLQEANQAMSTKIEMLEQQNQILKKNFNTIRDSLLNATGLSLGRMIIEAGLAVNELRDSMPSDPEPNEADLEEGELPDPEISFWKKRLDKMIKRISEAHSKSKEETKEIADTMTSMAEELQRLVDGHPAVRRSKRLRDVEEVDYAGEDGLDDEEDMEYSIERKRARYEENRQGFESQQFRPSMAFAQPDVSSKIPFSPLELESDEKNLVPVRTAPMEGIPLWVAQQNQTPISTPVLPAAPERLPLRDINPNVNAGSMGMHADRQKMLENIKVEEDVDVSTVVGPVVPVKAKKKWKIAFSMININEEESEWLTQAKEHWEKGGWTDRLAWLQAVMVEHRLLKATASSEAEADSQLRTLFYGIKAGRFINSMFSV